MIMKVEIRNNSVEISGYVNVPARDSRMLPSPRGKFVEQISPKVFERALGRTDNVDLLFNHKSERKLGSTSDGNLTLYEDNVGLRAICTVTDEEVLNKAKNNELRGWSFGFICREDRWAEHDGVQRRYVDDLDILEVSILDITPAYYATSIESRGDEVVITEQRFDDHVETVISESVTNSTTTELVKEVNGETIIETVRERTTDSMDYSLYEAEISILKLKGGY